MLFNKNGQGYALPNHLTSQGIVPHPLNVQAQMRGNDANPLFMGSVPVSVWNRIPMSAPVVSAHAVNPAKNNRVLIPGQYFEIIGR